MAQQHKGDRRQVGTWLLVHEAEAIEARAHEAAMTVNDYLGALATQAMVEGLDVPHVPVGKGATKLVRTRMPLAEASKFAAHANRLGMKSSALLRALALRDLAVATPNPTVLPLMRQEVLDLLISA